MLNPIAVLTGFRRLDRLFQLENKHGVLIEAQANEIKALQGRLTKLKPASRRVKKYWWQKQRGRPDRSHPWLRPNTSRKYPDGSE
jgi:hypothetical protein